MTPARSRVLQFGLFAWLIWACTTEDPTASFLPNTTTPAAASIWGASACGSCVRDRCAEHHVRCKADPSCARRLSCIEACPATSDGEPDPTCTKACPPATGTTAEAAAGDLELCRTEGGGTACESCTARVPPSTSPLLHQNCPNPTFDASSPDPQCALCLSARCCESRDRCLNDPRCNTLIDEIIACPDIPCQTASELDAGASYTGLAGTLACAELLCGKECKTETPCSTCKSASCADSWIECQSDPACAQFLLCSGTCPSIDANGCFDRCVSLFADGLQRFNKMFQCLKSRCPACTQ